MKKISKKKDYSVRGDKYNIEYIPEEVYRSLEGEELKYYTQYRNNQRYIWEGKNTIEKTRKEIKKLQKKISDKEQQLKVWEGKMMEGYSVIGYLGEDYDFNCSVNLREIKPKKNKGERSSYNTSVPYRSGKKMGRDTNNPSKDWEVWKNKYDESGDKELFMDKLEDIRREKRSKVNPKKYYVRIEPKSRSKFKNNQWIRNLYVGMRDEVIHLLKTSSPNTDWDKVSEKKLRDNLREIYKGYVRYQIYTNGVDCIKIGYNTKKGKEENPQSQHPSDKVIDWIKEIGTDIVEWMDK